MRIANHVGALALFAVGAESTNVLVLLADDFGYGDLNSYGEPNLIKTDNIDQLAKDGLQFYNWYAPSPICTPSRAGTLTGRLAVRTGLAGASFLGGVLDTTSIGGLLQDEVTFADIAKRNDYVTGMIGKWHLGQREEFLPTSHGFDSYLGIPYSVDEGSSAWGGLTGPFPRWPPLPLMTNTKVVAQPVDLSTLTQRYYEAAISFMEDAVSKNTNFLLYVAFGHAHVPNFRSKEQCGKSLRGGYGDAVEEMDNAVGEIVQAMKRLGVEDDTLVIFTSDNGPWTLYGEQGGSSGVFRDGKGTTWEGGQRVPGIIKWPRAIKSPGRKLNQQIVTTMDILPTVKALLEPNSSAGSGGKYIDGKNLLPLILASPEEAERMRHHECFFYYKGCDQGSARPGLWAVRCHEYKLHFVTNPVPYNLAYMFPFNYKAHDVPIMYNLDHDPSERHPIPSTSSEYQKANATIFRALEKHKATFPPTPPVNQIALGLNKDFAVCGCPQAVNKGFPNCTCQPENFEAFTCGAQDNTFIARESLELVSSY